MSGISDGIEWEPIAKWGAIGGVSALGVYLAYRWFSSRAEAEEMAIIESYRNILLIKKEYADKFLAKEITEAQYHTVDEPFEKRAEEIEEAMEKRGISATVRSGIIYAILGISGTYLAREGIREYIRRPPKPPTTAEKSRTVSETSETVPSTEEEKETGERSAQEKIASILHTSIGWVESNWEKIVAILILMGVGYALVQAVGGWAIPDEPGWVAGFTLLVRRFVGVPPVA